jgi:hypothetical protein
MITIKIGQRYASTGLQKGLGDTSPDTPAAAGDENNLSSDLHPTLQIFYNILVAKDLESGKPETNFLSLRANGSAAIPVFTAVGRTVIAPVAVFLDQRSTDRTRSSADRRARADVSAGGRAQQRACRAAGDSAFTSVVRRATTQGKRAGGNDRKNKRTHE